MNFRFVIALVIGLLAISVHMPRAAAQDNPVDTDDFRNKISKCMRLGVPQVDIEQFSGSLMQSQTKTAFDIAREKAARYGVKMPIRQGNNGNVRFKVETESELEPYPSLGCAAVKSVHVKITINHDVEIASEYQVGSCMYAELFNLETELMQQDEILINHEVENMQENLRAHFKAFPAYPISPLNINTSIVEKKRDIDALAKGMVAKIAEKAEALRRKSDSPEFYQDIVDECSGGGAQP